MPWEKHFKSKLKATKAILAMIKLNLYLGYANQPVF